MATETARNRMVDAQVARRGVKDQRVLAAMRAVPREKFTAPGLEEFAYEDSALPIAEGQTISQPYIVGAMLAAAELEPGDKLLEVGAGSGYAAAVASRVAGQVLAIERHAALTEAATRRLAELGYTNVTLKTGDGSRGWPEEAPFDAIIVSAGGPSMPEPLKQQLTIGGRLVIPVGPADEQRLVRLTRIGEDTFEQDDLGAVRFVKLIGQEGWKEQGRAEPQVETRAPSLAKLIALAAEPLPDFDDAAFAALFDRFAHKRVVLLGEASHGTSEFYQARAAITRRLIEKHGFTIVAVEADWPDAAAMNRRVRRQPPAAKAPEPFQGFPTWMWRNTDVEKFLDWLTAYNSQARVPCGFYGLDIYNMRAAITQVLSYLDKVDPEAAAVARQRYACLTPWQHDPSTYGRAVLTAGYRVCEEDVVRQCREMLLRKFDYARRDGDEFLNATQNARLIASAEQYYRIMYYGGAESWNLRDRHMFETLENLLDWQGPEAKAVVWAHNSHIGDARATAMGWSREEFNVGQLVREGFEQDSALIGMGTHAGTVACASDWDEEMEVKLVRPSREDSIERLCHDSKVPRFLVDFVRERALARKLVEERLERFIGVIYRPETELQSHYVEASLSRQFDAYLWFDQTNAVEQIGPERHQGVPDTYPFGV